MDEIILLNRIRVDIGNVSGSLSELMQYASMAGFNDAGEEQVKPRLVGTWTVNDWYTTAQLAQAQAAFDGLTIVGDPNYVIDFSQMAVQVLDDTQPNYNPAVAIVLQAAGYGNILSEPPIPGQTGRWFITIGRMEEGLTGAYFRFNNGTVVDTNGICGEAGLSYDLITFNEFKYFGNSHNFYYPGSGAWSDSLFGGNTKLKEITLPIGYTIKESVNTGSGMFSGCSSLETIHNIEYVDLTFYNKTGGAYSPAHFSGCKKLNGVTFPSGVLQFYNGMFVDCTDLEMSELPSTLTNLGSGAFCRCKSITITEFPIGVTSIPDNSGNPYQDAKGSFSGSSVVNLTFHSGINYIGAYAFVGCSDFEIAHFLSPTPPTIGNNAFNNCPKLKIYVGDGSSAAHDDAILADYLADTNWSTRSSILDTWYNYLHPTT